MSDRDPSTLGRRAFLIGSGAVLVGACSAREQSPDQEAAPSTTAATSTAPTTVAPTAAEADTGAATENGADGPPPITSSMFDQLTVCALAPSTTAGPFPTIDQLDRRDITEGRPGHPLRLGIRVVGDGCRPIPGAQVEIWHTDATGDYSSYEDGGSGKDEGDGTTFLRGFQTADADGILEFQTIYPGWYEGRAVHIHVAARLDEADLLTTQIYFDEAYTESVFQAEEYARFGPPDTPWAADRLIGDPTTDGTGVSLAPGPTSLGDGTLGLITLGAAR